MPADISQFKLQKAVMEIRYPQSLLIWDRSGKVWHEAQKQFPELKLRAAQPNQQQFTLTKDMVAQALVDRANITAQYPSNNLDTFRKAVDEIFSRIVREFEIAELSRIGLRLVYEKSFESLELATNFLLDSIPSMQREGKHFNIEGKVKAVDRIIRWEGETLGCVARLQTTEQKWEINLPLELSNIELPKTDRVFVLMDFDYYAHASTPVGKFSPGALVENWTKLIRRDGAEFIGG